MQFVFEVTYRNMMNFGNRGFSIENLYFEPISKFYNPDNPLSLGTGRLIINVPESITTLREAMSYFESIKPKIDRLSLLLSFCAHGHVEFSLYNCFEVVDGNKIRQREGRLGQRTGSSPSHWIVRRHSECLEDFISSVFPLLEDENYLQRTGVLDAMLYLEEANCFLDPWQVAFEPRYLTFWTAFEIMVHKHFDSKNEKVNDFLEDFGKLIDTWDFATFKNDLLSSLRRFFKNVSVKKKIRYFLEQSGFEQYKGVVVDDKLSMYGLRSQISHGGVSEYRPVQGELYQKLMRLVDKVVLKTLNYYENKRDCIHPIYLNSELSAMGDS